MSSGLHCNILSSTQMQETWSCLLAESKRKRLTVWEQNPRSLVVGDSQVDVSCLFPNCNKANVSDVSTSLTT